MSDEEGHLIRNHKDLKVWQGGIALVQTIYEITQSFPAVEQFGLTSQMRRAAVSIPSNIAEGAARASKKEFFQFLHIALGSLAELETQLVIARNLRYGSGVEESFLDLEKVRRMLLGLISNIRVKI